MGRGCFSAGTRQRCCLSASPRKGRGTTKTSLRAVRRVGGEESGCSAVEGRGRWKRVAERNRAAVPLSALPAASPLKGEVRPSRWHGGRAGSSLAKGLVAEAGRQQSAFLQGEGPSRLSRASSSPQKASQSREPLGPEGRPEGTRQGKKGLCQRGGFVWRGRQRVSSCVHADGMGASAHGAVMEAVADAGVAPGMVGRQ